MIQLPVMRRPRRQPQQVFIRFGLWSARSKNWYSGHEELGVSVYPAKLVNGYVEPDYDEMEISIQVIGRLAFPVTGKIVSRGSDGEPVLRKLKALPYAIAHDSMPHFLSPDTQSKGEKQ